MRARIEQIPVTEDATWGAVFAALMFNHREDWHFHWTGYRQRKPDAYSFIEIEAPGVVYAFNTVKGTADVGNVALVPLSRVIAAVS